MVKTLCILLTKNWWSKRILQVMKSHVAQIKGVMGRKVTWLNQESPERIEVKEKVQALRQLQSHLQVTSLTVKILK